MRRGWLVVLLGGGAVAGACDFGIDLDGLAADAATDVSGDVGDASGDAGIDAPKPSVPVVALGLGGSHTCGVRQNGTVVCWGANSNGQLGNGTGFDSSTPVSVALPTNNVVEVAGGQYHTCAVASAGGVLCWGQNTSGQLGDGTGVNKGVPVTAAGISNAVHIAACSTSTCAALKDGTVTCWGSNGNGEIGVGSIVQTHYLTPQAVTGLTGVVAIRGSVGGNHFCALTGTGGVWCWGQNTNGQIGNGTTTDTHSPTQVPGLGMVTDIATGTSHSCAVVAGAVYCWGNNTAGQLGNESTTSSNAPVTGDPTLMPPVTHITAGGSFTCGTTTTGVTCWGTGADGQIGNGKLTQAVVPAAAQTGQVTTVAAGPTHACAVVGNGAVECWGFDANGRLGLGRLLLSATPITVQGLGAVTELTVGADHSCANTADAGLVCWGDNQADQCGTSSGTFPATSVPVATSSQGLTGVAAGGSHVCGVRDAGAVLCFGSDYWGALGDGTNTTTGSGVRFGGNAFSGSAVGTGTLHTCALAGNGGVACAGYGINGQLGNGTQTTNSNAVTVIGVDGGAISGQKAVFAGSAQSCATTSTSMMCWGGNGYGQLGIGNSSTTTVATPVTVLAADAGLPISVALGGSHTCVVRGDGTVLCWGLGLSGQLGDGSGSTKTTPVVAQTSGPAVMVTAGANHTCAVLADHTMQCWGYAALGELGNGTTVNALTPVPVTGITQAVSARTFSDATCALLSDGTVRCWGSEPDGQLGDGSAVVVATPSFVVGL